VPISNDQPSTLAVRGLVMCLQSKKRGLSLEEKRKCVLEIFHDTKDVFQLKVAYTSFNDFTKHLLLGGIPFFSFPEDRKACD